MPNQDKHHTCATHVRKQQQHPKMSLIPLRPMGCLPGPDTNNMNVSRRPAAAWLPAGPIAIANDDELETSSRSTPTHGTSSLPDMTITSAEQLPPFILEEASLFLSVTEAQRLITRVCKTWCRVYHESEFLSARRILFHQFGLDFGTLPPLWSCEQWIRNLSVLIDDGRGTNDCRRTGTAGDAPVSSEQENRIVLRGYHPRWILIPRHLIYPRRSLHNGVTVLPEDFRFRFASNYSSPRYASDLQGVINSLRTTNQIDLVRLFSDDGLNNESRRRMMIEKVICLRNLASEQIELEVISFRHVEHTNALRQHQLDVQSRTRQTAVARGELLQLRDDLARAVNGDFHGLHPATILSVADDRILGLIPAADMCGNDKARCLELRGMCRNLMGTLENKVVASSASVMRLSSTMLPTLGNKKRKRNSPRSKVPRNINEVQKDFEEIKRSTVARLEALLRYSRGLMGGNESTDVSDARQIAQLRIQMESALFDVAHWK